jgi:hypothetical protein
MQRAIWTMLLSAIWNLVLYYYSSPPSRDVTSSWLGFVAELTLTQIYLIWRVEVRRGKRGSKVLEPLLCAREQSARTSERHENCITSGSPLCRGLTRASYIFCIEHQRLMLLGNRTWDLLHCRRTLYAKSHSNGVTRCYSEPRLVLLQCNWKQYPCWLWIVHMCH